MSSNKYNQLLKFLYFEGYADSYAEAEELLESMSDEEFEDLCEKHSFPLKPSERRSVENIGRMLGGDYSVPPGESTRKKSAKKVEKVEKQPQEQPQPRKRKKLEFEVKEEFDEIEEAKDIPQEVALKLADMLKGSPQLSKRGGMARGLRQYAIERNKKRLEKLQQNEEKKEFPTAKVQKQIDKHTSKSTSSWSGGKSDPRKTDSYGTRSRKMSAVKSSVERGEDPRKDSVQGDQRKIFTKQFGKNVSAKTVDNEKSAYTPGGLRAHQTKAGGYRKLTRKEELEMQEAWYSGKPQYRTTASGRKVRWDENDDTDTAVSDMLQKRREEAARKAAQARMKAKGTTPKKGGNEMFESIVEYLFVEGFADTIENAEVMAENISEGWVNEIVEAKVDWHNRDKENVQDRVKVLRDRNKRLEKDRPEIPSGRNQTDFRRKRHQDSRGKVNEENYEKNVQPPREPLKTDRNMFSISQKEKDAARERTLTKAKAMRAKKGIE